DQNDRHDDQQFDKTETLLLLHEVSLRECIVPEHALRCARGGPMLGERVQEYFNIRNPLTPNNLDLVPEARSRDFARLQPLLLQNLTLFITFTCRKPSFSAALPTPPQQLL
ncbi:MAG: hypothetical protein WCD68_04375, partial [Candidatus Acidiferrum sp.]